MVTRENIRELAQFQATHPDACALTFYFQPAAPQDKSHRSDAIQVKDLIRNAAREIEKQGKKSVRETIWIDSWSWLEASPPTSTARRPYSPAVQWISGANSIFRRSNRKNAAGRVNRAFELKPLAALLGAHPRLCLALVDRQRARFFDLRLDELSEREGLLPQPAAQPQRRIQRLRRRTCRAPRVR